MNFFLILLAAVSAADSDSPFYKISAIQCLKNGKYDPSAVYRLDFQDSGIVAHWYPTIEILRSWVATDYSIRVIGDCEGITFGENMPMGS